VRLRAPTQELGRLEVVELVLLLVEAVVGDVEQAAADEGEHGHEAVVPDEERVSGQRDEGLGDGGRDGIHEEVDGLDW